MEDYCICTIPLGVLQQRKIAFVPDLPEHRWKAIDSIGMGLLDKIVLTFGQSFWGDYQQFGIADAADPTLVKSFYDCSREVGGDAVLMVFLGGNSARRLSAMAEQEEVQDTMAALRKVFDNVPDLVASKVTRWMQDPWACGSYSFAKVGSTAEVYDTVAGPIGNLLFAGEHTSKHAHSTVHGAWETGQREAKRLC